MNKPIALDQERGGGVSQGSSGTDAANHRPIACENQRPHHISADLRSFLVTHEARIREMATAEHDAGTFTPGLSRCLDLLDDERWPQ